MKKPLPVAFTEDEAATIRVLYATHTAKQIADILGRRETQITNKIKNMGMSKRESVYPKSRLPPDYMPRTIASMEAMAKAMKGKCFTDDPRACRGERPLNKLPDPPVLIGAGNFTNDVSISHRITGKAR